MLALLSKLRLFCVDYLSFPLQLVALRAEQVLESEHKFFEKCVDRRALPRLKVPNHTLLLFNVHCLGLNINFIGI